jgi:lipid-A-disaccharide synthase
MLDAAEIIVREREYIQFILPLAPGLSPEDAHRLIAERSPRLQSVLRIVHKETRESIAASDAAAVASGTATLEAALLGTPMVIVYKASLVNWNVLGRLIKTDHYGLVNLISGERLAPELIQGDLNGPRLAAELLSLLDSETNQALRSRLAKIATQLGEGNASHRAATRILAALE